MSSLLDVIPGADALSFFDPHSLMRNYTLTSKQTYKKMKGKSAAMIQMNKETSLMKSERASAPGIIDGGRKSTRSGSVTIEASVAIPFFLFAAVCLIWLIEMQSIRISILTAAQHAAKSASEQTAFMPVLNTVKLKSDIVSLIGEERIGRSIIEGGASGISCWKSWMSPETGEMEITVDYKIQLPLGIFGNPSADQRETFRLHGWNGYKGGNDDGTDSEIVYITDHEAVFHEDIHCSYLELSIRFVSSTQLADMRNEGGGKYHACEKCVFGTAMAGVYITGTGTKYHNSLNCSGLKRTIYAVERSEVKGLRGCSRCTD